MAISRIKLLVACLLPVFVLATGCGGDEPKVMIPENPTLPPPNASLMTNEQMAPTPDNSASQQQH